MRTLTNTFDACHQYGVTADAIYDMTGITTDTDRLNHFLSLWGNEPDENYSEPDEIDELSNEAWNLGTYRTHAAAIAAMEG